MIKDVTTSHKAFYFQGSMLLLLFCRSWSGSLYYIHIELQELKADTSMLHRVAFHLSGKVVALHLNNRTAKAYI